MELPLMHYSKMSVKDINVYAALSKLYLQVKDDKVLAAEGIKTRDIANAAEMDIYGTRYSLLKLTRLGYASPVLKANRNVGNWILVSQND